MRVTNINGWGYPGGSRWLHPGAVASPHYAMLMAVASINPFHNSTYIQSLFWHVRQLELQPRASLGGPSHLEDPPDVPAAEVQDQWGRQVAMFGRFPGQPPQEEWWVDCVWWRWQVWGVSLQCQALDGYLCCDLMECGLSRWCPAEAKQGVGGEGDEFSGHAQAATQRVDIERVARLKTFLQESQHCAQERVWILVVSHVEGQGQPRLLGQQHLSAEKFLLQLQLRCGGI